MELDVIRKEDIEVANYIEAELKRQQNTIELIASENFTSPAVMAAQGSVLTNTKESPIKDFITGVKTLIKLKSWQLKDAKNFLIAIIVTFSRIRGRRLIWPCFYMR